MPWLARAPEYTVVRWVYLRLLGVAPDELMLVAAHPGDLKAARATGLRTAYVDRTLEHGPGRRPYRVDPGEFDVVAADFVDLAEQLGA